MQTVHNGLIQDPALSNFDFHHAFAPRWYRHSLDNSDMELTAKFTWAGGVAGADVIGNQHAVLAFTQNIDPNSLQNGEGQRLWSHGVGAIVGEFGLGLELWFKPDANNNGLPDDVNNGIVWTQLNSRFAGDVLGQLPPNVMQLQGYPHPAGYITAAPGFKLRRQVPYWLRIRITKSASSPGWARLFATLAEERTAGTATIVQQGLVGFEPAQFFPVAGAHIDATVARTPGTPADAVISYSLWDEGF